MTDKWMDLVSLPAALGLTAVYILNKQTACTRVLKTYFRRR